MGGATGPLRGRAADLAGPCMLMTQHTTAKLHLSHQPPIICLCIQSFAQSCSSNQSQAASSEPVLSISTSACKPNPRCVGAEWQRPPAADAIAGSCNGFTFDDLNLPRKLARKHCHMPLGAWASLGRGCRSCSRGACHTHTDTNTNKRHEEHGDDPAAATHTQC